MKRYLQPGRLGARFLLATVATVARLSAADEPAPAAPAAPAAAPVGSWFVFSPPKDDEVLAPQSRIKLLALSKVFLERDKPDLLARLKTADNPFFGKAPPPPTPVASNTTNTGSTPTEPAAPPKMSDEDKLKAVAEKLEPTGMIEGAGKRLVTLSGGGAIEVGQSFTATVPPDLTTVLTISIIDANENECVLKLNGTTLQASYVSKPTGAARPPTSPTSSQPKP